MSLAILITSMAGELNDTFTANNGGTVMRAISAGLHGGLGNGKTSTSKYLQEADHLADKVFPAVKNLTGGGDGNSLVTIAYIHATPTPLTVQYTDIQAFQADFEAQFATYYPALGAL